MATTRCLVILLITALALTAPVTAADKPAQQKPASGTRSASCIVKVTADPAVLPVNFDAIEYIVRSSGVAVKAAREVLGLSQRRIDELLSPDSPFETPEGQGILIMESLSDDVSALPTGIPLTPVTPSAPPAIRPEPLVDVPQVEPKLEEDPYAEATRAVNGTSPARPSPPVMPVPRRSVSTRALTRSPSSPGPYGSAIGEPFSVQQTVIFRLIVQLPDDCPNAKAEEFARDLIENLKLALMRASDEHRNRLNTQAESAREETNRCENELRSLQIDLRKVSGSRSLDRGDLLRGIAILRDQIDSREMNKATSSAYVDSITKQIAENQAKLEERLRADEVTKELGEIVRSNAESLARMEQLVKDGRAPAAELSAPQEKLTRTKIDLAKRREELAKSGSGMIENLTRKLTDLTTESSRTDAEIINLKRQLEEATQFLERAGDYEILSLRADAAMQNLREMIVLSSQLERRIRLVQPPQVSVIGAE